MKKENFLNRTTVHFDSHGAVVDVGSRLVTPAHFTSRESKFWSIPKMRRNCIGEDQAPLGLSSHCGAGQDRTGQDRKVDNLLRKSSKTDKWAPTEIHVFCSKFSFKKILPLFCLLIEVQSPVLQHYFPLNRVEIFPRGCQQITRVVANLACGKISLAFHQPKSFRKFSKYALKRAHGPNFVNSKALDSLLLAEFLVETTDCRERKNSYRERVLNSI